MKKYMVVMSSTETEGPIGFFTDDIRIAQNAKMDFECGLGGYAEVYERITDEEGLDRYELLYA